MVMVRYRRACIGPLARVEVIGSMRRQLTGGVVAGIAGTFGGTEPSRKEPTATFTRHVAVRFQVSSQELRLSRLEANATNRKRARYVTEESGTRV